VFPIREKKGEEKKRQKKKKHLVFAPFIKKLSASGMMNYFRGVQDQDPHQIVLFLFPSFMPLTGARWFR